MIKEEVKAPESEAAVDTAKDTAKVSKYPVAWSKPSYKKRFGDRYDGRKLRTIQPMLKVMPYIMEKRSDACNTFSDSIEVSKVDELVRAKVRSGKTNFSLLHIILAAYVRTVSQRPGINRFVSGQKIYSRNNILVNMTIKREMAIDAPDTMVKIEFEPTDTLDEVYEKFNTTVENALAQSSDDSGIDTVAKLLSFIPGGLLKFAVRTLRSLDYVGLLPKALNLVSPFHGSMIITSMGSLGIKPIYHHLYDFGNLPVFISYGAKRTVVGVDSKGNITKKKYVDLKVVTDERICDGFYYASCFKFIKRYIENPTLLEIPPEEVIPDCE
jgi:pyruvate/2-oxoglutarate dehydrogenase complex dihydrolipoamide acyltransferase (E2) component